MAVQEFIDSLLDECAKVGISEIGNNVPETAWHGGGQNTVEDTLRTAVQYGQETFGQKPRIIFILLPGNGRPCVQTCVAVELNINEMPTPPPPDLSPP